MLSSIKQPKTKRDLVKSIQDLPNNIKFDVLEVSSSSDKQKVQRNVDTYLRKGGLTLVLIEHPK
jgi:hypothetical protein